jgi:hypothetical protein
MLKLAIFLRTKKKKKRLITFVLLKPSFILGTTESIGGAGSIPDGVTGIFQWHNPSGRTIALGVDSASNRNEYQVSFLRIKAAGAWGWHLYHHPVPLSWNVGTLNSWNPLGHSRPITGLLYPLYIEYRLPRKYFWDPHRLVTLHVKHTLDLTELRVRAGKIHDSDSGYYEFKSRTGDQKSWAFFMAFFSPSRWFKTVSFRIRSNSLPSDHSTTKRY